LADSATGRAHLNLVASWRHLFGLDPGAAVEARDGLLFGAARPSHPVISNAVFRTDDGVDAGELISRARGFFGERGRGFTIWTRHGVPEDEDLVAAAEEAGFQCVHEMPAMMLEARPSETPLAEGVELLRLSTAEQAEDYWRIAAAAYSSLGYPSEVFDFYENSDGLTADNVAAFLGNLDGEPVSIAMTIVSHGVAGIYWVGSLEAARGRGIGGAVTSAATNAGFDLGADVASLQASRMGRPIYEAMGYESVFDYRLLMSPAP
jgi:hypothetical protein